MNLDQYDISMSRHLLTCAHQIGHSRRMYEMDCLVLGESPSGKIKLIVFGDRDWSGRDHIKHVRYVERSRIKKKEKRT